MSVMRNETYIRTLCESLCACSVCVLTLKWCRCGGLRLRVKYVDGFNDILMGFVYANVHRYNCIYLTFERWIVCILKYKHVEYTSMIKLVKSTRNKNLEWSRHWIFILASTVGHGLHVMLNENRRLIYQRWFTYSLHKCSSVSWTCTIELNYRDALTVKTSLKLVVQ